MKLDVFINKIKPIIYGYSINDNDYKQKLGEVADMLTNAQNFTSRAKAKKATGLAYLGGLNSSAKVKKGKKLQYDTLILYLAAADMSGFNICPQATEGCRRACLVDSGRARMITKGSKISSVNWARLKKTWLFFYNRHFFMSWLDAEISAHKTKAAKKGVKFAVRLNGTSDLNIKLFKVGGELLVQKHSDIQFYDYTKISKQLDNALDFPNYDVTFSYANSSEHNNKLNAFGALAMGLKISVVFDKSTFPNKEFPYTFFGHKVVNGDTTDLTFLQDEGKVLALDFKKNGSNSDDNKFIISYQDYLKMHE